MGVGSFLPCPVFLWCRVLSNCVATQFPVFVAHLYVLCCVLLAQRHLEKLVCTAPPCLGVRSHFSLCTRVHTFYLSVLVGPE